MTSPCHTTKTQDIIAASFAYATIGYEGRNASSGETGSTFIRYTRLLLRLYLRTFNNAGWNQWRLWSPASTRSYHLSHLIPDTDPMFYLEFDNPQLGKNFDGLMDENPFYWDSNKTLHVHTPIVSTVFVATMLSRTGFF